MMKTSRLLTFGFAVATLAACGDPLDVTNANNPETDRVLATPADVEALIRNSYGQAMGPILGSDGINMQMGTMAFENSAMAANFGMVERSAFPRSQILNTVSDQFSADYYEVWSESYTAIRAASDGLERIARPGFSLGSPANTARAEAFARFVLGFAHANLAVTYDQASVYDETIPADSVVPLAPYGDVMDAALGYMDQAIQIAQANPSISFPSDWMGVEVNGAQFVRIVNSYKARYRTQVARSAAERQAIDWNAAIAEVDAGITSDYAVTDNDDVWDFWMQDYMSFKGAWHQAANFIHGMADTSGAYQTWMSTPIGSREAIVIQTPDKRFPQGNTLAAQLANQGTYINAKAAGGAGGWVRAERGTWRWSNYVDDRYAEYYANGVTGAAVPLISKTEMDLIKAEGLIRTNRAADALPLINATRVGNGGLPAATLAGAPGGNACVPKLPTGACGDLIETLKWEKRMEQFMTVYGGWFLDSRGWGDLAEGTPLHWPVPARELEVRQLPLYTFGGAGQEGSAPIGNYGY